MLITFTLLVNIFLLANPCFGADFVQSSKSTIDNTESVANLICTGQFLAAKKLLATKNDSDTAGFSCYSDIVSEYEAIEKIRQIARANTYHKQLDKLRKLYKKSNTEGDCSTTDVLEIILKTRAYATNKQKKALFEDAYVRQIFDKATNKAEELDANGEWLEAYSYYYYLEKLFPNNKLYTDLSKQLETKIDIKTSLLNSPCETYSERYVGVNRQIFIEAINTLDADYVVRIANYKHMAIKAIKRCQILAEVIVKPDDEIAKNNHILSLQGKDGIRDWSTKLAAITDELKQSTELLSKEKFITVFDEILALNTLSARLPQQVLIVQFTKGALSALDPHTIIVWPSQVSNFQKRLNGKFSGIGITFTKENKSWVVSSLLLNTPAYKAGVRVGDVIEAVDGSEAKEMNVDCMIKKITGTAGTTVTLTVKRSDGNKLSNITIIRANVNIPSIRGWKRNREEKWQYIIDNRNQIGYIRIATFAENTAENFEKILFDLEAKGLKGLVLDLRSNPGGIVTAAAKIVDKFIKKGMIVSTCPRYGMATYMSAHEENTHPDYPIVVLTNKNSASASEIVAGALQDRKHKRAILVGERTFGKGSVQNIKSLSGYAKLKYTMAYYRLPSGQRVEGGGTSKISIDNSGVMPDVVVKMNTEEIEKLTNNNTIITDPQLAIGLLILRGKMTQEDYLLAMN